MENNTKIIILSVLLGLSLILNVTLFYVLGHNEMEWEKAYDDTNKEWCEIVNQGNVVINLLLDELIDYNEGYDEELFIDMLECFS